MVPSGFVEGEYERGKIPHGIKLQGFLAFHRTKQVMQQSVVSGVTATEKAASNRLVIPRSGI